MARLEGIVKIKSRNLSVLHYTFPARTIETISCEEILSGIGKFTLKFTYGDGGAYNHLQYGRAIVIEGQSGNEIFVGLIEEFKNVQAGNDGLSVTVEGVSNLDELANERMSGVKISEIVTEAPNRIELIGNDLEEPIIYTTLNDRDGVETKVKINPEEEYYLYLGSHAPIYGAYVVARPHDNENTAFLRGQYFQVDGHWHDLQDFWDGTRTAYGTMSQNGHITWSPPAGGHWGKETHSDLYRHWVRLFLPFDTTGKHEVFIDQVQIRTDGPTSGALSSIISHGPAGWGVTGDATSGEMYHLFEDETVFQVLRQYTKRNGESFRQDNGRNIKILKSFPHSGVTARRKVGEKTENDAYITRFTVTHHEPEATKIYVYGAGNGEARLRMTDATADTGGYILNGPQSSLTNTTAESVLGYRREKTIQFKNISTIGSSGRSIQASNELLSYGVKYLDRASLIGRKSIEMDIAGLEKVLRAGDKITINYSSLQGGYTESGTYVILRIKYTFKSDGSLVCSLVLSVDDTRPTTGKDLLTQFMELSNAQTSSRQPITWKEIEGAGYNSNASISTGGTAGVSTSDFQAHQNDPNAHHYRRHDLLSTEDHSISGTEGQFLGLPKNSQLGLFADIAWKNGKLGLGTTAPAARLDIVGGENVHQLRLRNNSTQSVDTLRIENQVGSDLFAVESSGRLRSRVGIDVLGNANRLQYRIRAHTTQTEHIFSVEDSSGSELFLVDGTGRINAPLGSDPSNTFLGRGSGFLGLRGTGNTATGSAVMRMLSAGSRNVGTGVHALDALSTGDNNVAIGAYAGNLLQSGSSNVFIGSYAGRDVTIGSNQFRLANAIGEPFLSGDFSARTFSINADSKTRSLIPQIDDTYDIGSLQNRYRMIHGSELRVELFSKDTTTLSGGRVVIPHQSGILAASFGAGDSQIDFSGVSVSAGDIVEFRGLDSTGIPQFEYMRVDSKAEGSIYNVVRNLDGTGSNEWAESQPYHVLGQSGDGWIELDAQSQSGAPRISVLKTGTAYNNSAEVFRAGNLNGLGGINSDVYGFYAGDGASNYVRYRGDTNKLETSGTIYAQDGRFDGVVEIGTAGALRQGTGIFGNDDFTGLSLHRASGVGVMETYLAGTKQVEINTKGQILAGDGAVVLDSAGIHIDSAEVGGNAGLGASTQNKYMLTFGPGDDVHSGVFYNGFGSIIVGVTTANDDRENASIEIYGQEAVLGDAQYFSRISMRADTISLTSSTETPNTTLAEVQVGGKLRYFHDYFWATYPNRKKTDTWIEITDDWNNASLAGGWTNYSGEPVQYRMLPTGHVEFRGRAATTGTNRIAFNLPAPYRPSTNQIFTIAQNPTASSIEVVWAWLKPNGDFLIDNSPIACNWVSFCNIRIQTN